MCFFDRCDFVLCIVCVFNFKKIPNKLTTEDVKLVTRCFLSNFSYTNGINHIYTTIRNNSIFLERLKRGISDICVLCCSIFFMAYSVKIYCF